MHRLTSNFVLGYHGCDEKIGQHLLGGAPFQHSDNAYDWLGPGIYFWEANPQRGIQFAQEASRRLGSGIKRAFVVGAVIELGLCLDLTTSAGLDAVRAAHDGLVDLAAANQFSLPGNSSDQLRRNLDCAVIRYLHSVREDQNLPTVDTVKGVFTEGEPLYPGSGFLEKTHIQIAVRNPECIKGVFRVTA